jgi:hypothetical protein
MMFVVLKPLKIAKHIDICILKPQKFAKHNDVCDKTT